jgi:hypothetical protein
VLPSALVPGSRVKSTGTPRQSRLSLPYIGGAPGGRSVSQQRHSFQPTAAGERRTKARRALGSAARGRIAGEISLRAAESVVESPVQLPLRALRHAANRHPAQVEHRLRWGKGRALHRRDTSRPRPYTGCTLTCTYLHLHLRTHTPTYLPPSAPNTTPR